MKNLKEIFAIMMAVATLIIPTGCSSDNDNEPETKAAGYDFEFTFTKLQGSDQSSILKTTMSYVDYQNKEQTCTYKAAIKETVKSQLYTKVPGDLTITVVEELKPDVTFTKESYNTGIGMQVIVKSYDDKKGIIDSQLKSNKDLEELSEGIAAKDLAQLYPQTTTYKFHIDEKGKITDLNK